ncbi:hypothetical protein TNCV_2818431 [Trichonephila clavipes]|nr:hypothetical protein TNCV_2818431 [Trichonephila clavipes]
MAEFSGQSFIPSNIGRVDGDEMISPSRGISNWRPTRFANGQLNFPNPEVGDIIKMGRTILLERRQSESVGRRNSRTTFLRSDWPRPFVRREVGVEMELGRSENKRPEQRRS